MTQGRRRGIRWGRIVLVLSLALNLAILGAGIGMALRWDAARDRARAMHTRDFGFGPYVGAFSREDRRALGRAFVEEAGDWRAARREARESVETLIATLRAEPFDAERFQALLLAQHARFAARQKIGAELVVARIGEMQPEDRIAYADRLEEILTRPPHPPHGGDRPREAASDR
ncbi:Heavy-metal resistance [Celeribacter indicus]|nr:Heavy-metal resistance [Celeribacter indicus]